MRSRLSLSIYIRTFRKAKEKKVMSIIRLISLFITLNSINAQLSQNTGYVVIVSPPFFGHLIPLLDLAKTLTEFHHVTFVLSSSKLDELKRRELIPKNLDLEFVQLFDNNNEEYQVQISL